MTNAIRWDLLDDRTFVGLIADLLRRRGFVDVSVQGEGPDGGLDILATEMVAFSFEGARPIRWGVQCKFSVPTGRRQVTDQEIRDVEGILRSDRFSVHDLGGYMLVTNRRVAYNVIDRLRGIDRTTEFRTSIVDGQRLELLLSEEPTISNLYFGRVLEQIQRLAEEQALEQSAELRTDSSIVVETQEVSSVAGSGFFEGNLSGTYDSVEGHLELDHDEITGIVTGQYCWYSDDYVADLTGNYDDGIITYRFEWRERSLSGSGFHFVSPDGRQLEGMWFPTELPLAAELATIFQLGRRKSYRRMI